MRALVGPALFALALGACSEEQPVDPLAPEAIEDAARAEGDGEGDALTGRYSLRAEPVACDCPELDGVDLCAPLFASVVEVLQVDGYMTLRPADSVLGLQLSGAIDRDGGFLVAGIYDLDTLVSSGSVYARVDGEFAGDRSFAGDLDDRLVGAIGGESFDCRASYAVAGLPLPAG